MDGILLFNKPILWTSHDAVDFIRRRLGQKAVGHAGTLDPMATGLLVILLGKATKRSEELSGLDKDYRGSLCLGIATDTQDLEGKILSSKDYGAVEEEDIVKVFSEMTGTQEQIPPIYSAIHQNGKRLYALARQGIAVLPKSREVTIAALRLERFFAPEIHFFLSCSKGTYVRSVCDLIGQKLGCGAALSALVRTRIGSMGLTQALNAGELASLDFTALEKRLWSSKF